MQQPTLKPMAQAELAGCMALLGPPPLLSTENEERFNAVFDRVVASLMPQDFIELNFIWQFVCASWNIARLTRHATLGIDRNYQQRLDVLALTLMVRKAYKMKQQPGQGLRVSVAEYKMLERASSTDEILALKPSEMDQNLALEKSMEFQECIDRLLVNQTKLRNDALHQLEFYRAGLGQMARQASAQIIEAEYHEVEAQSQPHATPSLIPPAGNDSDDVEQKTRSESTQ